MCCAEPITSARAASNTEEREPLGGDKPVFFSKPHADDLLPCKQNFVVQSVYKEKNHPKPPAAKKMDDESRSESLLKAINEFLSRIDIA